jgi:ABC-2 type transport system ATP-binding protein
MLPLLQVDNVRKRYTTVTAVDGVSLSVAPGERLALIGPNGAGKSSLIRMILGLTLPDEGRITLTFDGASSSPGPQVAPRIGFLPEERGLYQDVPLLRTLAYFGELRGMERHKAERAAQAWLERLSLSDRAKEPVKSLSKGNQQKMQLAAALLHEPTLAILDEPFSGLDPINQEFLLDLIRDIASRGTTVLFSAHQMQLVERLADHIVVMKAGRVVLEGSPAAIAERSQAGDVLVLTLNEPSVDATDRNTGHADSAHSAELATMSSHPAVLLAEYGDGAIRLTLRRGERLGTLLADAARAFDIVGVRSERATLHDIYVRTVSAPTEEAA